MAYGNNNTGRNTYNPERSYNRPAPYVAPTPPAPVEPPKPAINLSRTAHVHFKDNNYDIALLRMQAGPKIEVGKSELHSTVFAQVRVAELPLADLYSYDPIFAKYEGKYVIVLGHKAAEDQLTKNGKMTGKLLSNPTLKRAKLG